MAIEVKQQKQSNLGVLLILILILVIGGWFAWNFLKPIEILQKPSIEDLLPGSTHDLTRIELNVNEVFNHPVFQTLFPHIAWPLEIPQLGRNNPFAPF